MAKNYKPVIILSGRVQDAYISGCAFFTQSIVYYLCKA